MTGLTMGAVAFAPVYPSLPKMSDAQLAELKRAMREGPGTLILPMPDPVQTTFFGFFHTDCTFESAAALVSLHRTKAGAYRAMNRRQWREWEELQHQQRMPRRHRVDSVRGRKIYVFEESFIRAVEVQP